MKSSNRFLAIFAKSTAHTDTNFFYKNTSASKKNKSENRPNPNNNNFDSSIQGLGFAAGKKQYIKGILLNLVRTLFYFDIFILSSYDF